MKKFFYFKLFDIFDIYHEILPLTGFSFLKLIHTTPYVALISQKLYFPKNCTDFSKREIVDHIRWIFRTCSKNCEKYIWFLSLFWIYANNMMYYGKIGKTIQYILLDLRQLVYLFFIANYRKTLCSFFLASRKKKVIWKKITQEL